MKVTPTTSSKRQIKQTSHSSRMTKQLLKNDRKKRKLSCSSMEDRGMCKGHKRQKKDRINNNYFCKSFPDDIFPENSLFSQYEGRLIIEGKSNWDKVKPLFSQFQKKETKSDFTRHLSQSVPGLNSQLNFEPKCWINDLPQEVLLKVFSYLPLGVLLQTVTITCKKWEILAGDWTLWRKVEDLTVKNMVMSTARLRKLLRTIRNLKKLELILRNDTDELLHELFESHQNLEVLKLDRCCHSTLQMNMLSQTVTSVLEFCPKLRTIVLTDTYFRSKNFYRCLAKKFKTIERINVTCTSKSEMDVFMANLKENIPEVEFQNVPMMGRAAGKQIYWGPILGLVVRPTPTSPFHQQYTHDCYPNYVF